MDDLRTNQFRPDYAIPPGVTLLETIDHMGMSQAELALRIGRPKKTVNEIIKGKAALTPETAIQLERALGIPATFWNNLESHYREAIAAREEKSQLEHQIQWVKQFPVSSMVKLGWLKGYSSSVDQLREVLNFLGVASPDSWQDHWTKANVAYRKSAAFEADPGSVAAWLRQGELQAHRIETAPFDADAFRAALKEIRALTVETPQVFCPRLEALAARAGVAVTFVRELPKIRTSGATRWLTPTKALIQLSLRYKTDDQLWFTFFHEAAHILLHGKSEVFLEETGLANEKENEANRFAAEILVPGAAMREFVSRGVLTKKAIIGLAAQLRIAPGIVIGQMQHMGVLKHSYCNDLKRRFEWAN